MRFKKLSEFKDYCEKLKKEENEIPKIKVCITGCRAAGSIEIFEKFKEKIENSKKIKLVPTGCQKFCSGGPVVKVEFDGSSVLYEKVSLKDVDKILKKTEKKEIVDELVLKNENFLKNQTFKVLKLCGEINPLDVDDYIKNGGFSSFLKVIEEYTPEKVIEELKKSKLRGRGGAGFPTYLKWDIVRRKESDEKFVICNGDEGDPGAFMDRTLLEGVPFQVIEGMLICAYTIGAKNGYFYVRAEYPIAIEHIEKAINILYDIGLCGKNILGTSFSFDIELKKGAGAFVCGEETALIASIEGKRGMPRPRPPFPAEKGLFEKPTCINNVETFANIPIVIKEGGENFSKIGTERSGGTKIFSLAGKIKNTGLVEVPLGTPLWKIIYEIGGGPLEGRKIKGVQTGGPSGGCIPIELFNTPVDYETFAFLGSIMGSGGMIVIDDKVCIVELARYFLDFVQKESCGKCIPCRIGTKRMLEIFEKIISGKGEKEDLEKLEELGNYIKENSLCGLGQTAPNPVLTTIKYFRDEYLEHIYLNYCKSGQCKNLTYAPCTNSCPAGVDVPAYIEAIENGDFIKSYEIICKDLPFPSICGRACYAPCENMCRRKDIDKEVGIRILKKFVCDYAWEKGLSVKNFTKFKPQINKKVAVIGGGISGLTCAYFLSREGIRVDIYEKEKDLGGVVKNCIPEFRLPEKIVKKEIEDILNDRIKVYFNKILGKNIEISELEKKYDAIYISIGTETRSIEKLKNVYDGVEFLRKVKSGKIKKLKGKVGIIGGGNVAIDCGRTAKRLGAKDVYVIYRRTEEEMPAHKFEIIEGKMEKIKFYYLLLPEKMENEDGKVKVILRKMKIADELDKDGRRKIMPTEEKIVQYFDCLIYAIGQKTELNKFFEYNEINKFYNRVEGRKIFIGGDFLRGPSSIIDAIGDGKKSAFLIIEYLTGKKMEKFWMKKIEKEMIKPEKIEEYPKQSAKFLSLKERLKSFKEVEKNISKKQAIIEAKRCLKCHLEK
ncbi:MAG: FAD-dependent oxidoreductase [Candidatus Omnitrophica bacterium]|nr:FAD-dependent oxidoreductase [Candidatus Omnitrophota bacterium]